MTINGIGLQHYQYAHTPTVTLGWGTPMTLLTVILVVEPTSELTLEGVLALVLSLLTPSSSHDSIRAFR